MAKVACSPFSLGPRSCVAETLALTTMLLTVATVMWSIDFRAAEGEIGRLGEAGSAAGNMQGTDVKSPSFMVASRSRKTDLNCDSGRGMLKRRNGCEASSRLI